MIRNYFRVIHFIIEKIIIGGFPHYAHDMFADGRAECPHKKKKKKIIIGNTQPAHDVPRTSPKGPNVRDLQGTFRELARYQYKNWWFYEKSVFQR